MAESLGVAVLELTADLKPLEVQLARGEQMTALSLGKAQAEATRRLSQTTAAMGGMGRESARAIESATGPVNRLSAGLAGAGREASQAELKLRGYQLQVQAAEQRVVRLSEAVASGRGNQARLNGELQVAQGRLGLAQARTRAFEEQTIRSSVASRTAAGAHRNLGNEAQTLAGKTGKAESSLQSLARTAAGPAGGAMTVAASHMQLLRKNGVDYLAAGLIGLEATFIASSAKAAISFEELGHQVQRQTGLSGKSLDDLMGTIRRVARDSPYSMNEVAQAAITMRTQFHANDTQIEHSANLLVAYAHATGQEVQPALQQLSRIMHDFRVPAGDAVKVTDELIGVAQATQQPLAGFANSIDRFGPRFQALGLNMQDSIRLMGIFAASGIRGEQMGRGLTSALGNLMKAAGMGGAAKSMQDMGLKTKEANLSVEAAQNRVSGLEDKINKLKPASKNYASEQAKLNEELNVAQQRLDIARQKSDDLTKSTKAATKQHGDLSKVMDEEIHRIGSAKTYTDALNIAVDSFGKNMGPSMARAFWHNRDAIAEADKAMRRHNETQKLFNVDAASMPGRLQEAKNAFHDLEIEVGEKVLPKLSDAAKWFGGAVRDVDKFYKANKSLVDSIAGPAGIIAALTLLSRHSPLGSLLGPLAQRVPGIGGTLGRILGGSRAGSIVGTRGPVAPGSAANPLAVWSEGGFGGGGGGMGGGSAGGLSQAEKDAKNVESNSRKVARGLSTVAKSLPIIGTAIAIASQTRLPNGQTLGQYSANALRNEHPSTSMNFNAWPGLQGRPQHYGQFSYGGTSGVINAGRLGTPITGPTQIGAGDAPFIKQTAEIERTNKDFVVMNSELVKLAKNQQGVKQTASALDHLAVEAKKAGDVKWAMADRLGAELLRSRNVGSRGVRSIIGELNKLEPGARYAASQSMIQMTRTLEQQGRLPKNSSAKLVTAMLQDYKSLKDKGGKYWNGLMTDAKNELQYLEAAARNSSGKTRDQYLAAIQQLKDGVRSKLDAMLHSDVIPLQNQLTTAIKNGSHDAMVAGSTNIGQFATNVRNAFKAGTLGANDAVQLINQALGAELKAYGVTKIPTVADIQGNVQAKFGGSMGSFAGTAIGMGTAAARGGVIPIGRPGEGGTDNVPVNMMVGRGETVAVFNRHQYPEVQQRFADQGGLEGFFSRRMTPNYMNSPTRGFASGGVAFSGPASTFGPPGEPAGSTALGGHSSAEPGLSLRQPGTSWNDPSNRALMGQTFRITIQGRSGSFMDIDLGPADWTGKNVDVTGAAAQQMGLWPFPTGAIAQINGGGPGGVAGGTWVPIMGPTIKGTGPIADDVRAMAKLGTDAANAYGQAHMPKPTVGGSASPMSGPAAVQAMVAAANAITAQHFPYLWGGGHGSFSGPYDCSGAVSAVLHAAGLLGSPLDSTSFESWGAAGPGQWVDIFANPSHVWMTLNGHAFSTSGSNPGGGAGWMPALSTSGYVERHPPGLASGGVLDMQLATIRDPGLRERTRQHLSDNPDAVLPGLADGGLIYAQSGALARAAKKTASPHGKPHSRKHKQPHPKLHKPPLSPGKVHLKTPTSTSFPDLDIAMWLIADATGPADTSTTTANTKAAGLGLPQNWSEWLSGGVNPSYSQDQFAFSDPATAIITRADGSEVINWFDPAKGDQYPWYGLVDPSTGKRAKSIHARLAQLGVGAPDASQDGSLTPGFYTQDKVGHGAWTEYGIRSRIVDDYTAAEAHIIKAKGQIGSYVGGLLTNVGAEADDINWLLHALGYVPDENPFDVQAALQSVDDGAMKKAHKTLVTSNPRLFAEQTYAALRGKAMPKNWLGFEALLNKSGKPKEAAGGFRQYVLSLLPELVGAQLNQSYLSAMMAEATGGVGGGSLNAWTNEKTQWYQHNPLKSTTPKPTKANPRPTATNNWGALQSARVADLENERRNAVRSAIGNSFRNNFAGLNGGDLGRQYGWQRALWGPKGKADVNSDTAGSGGTIGDINRLFRNLKGHVGGAGSYSAAQSAEETDLTHWGTDQANWRADRQGQWAGISNPFYDDQQKGKAYAPKHRNLGRDTAFFQDVSLRMATMLSDDSKQYADTNATGGLRDVIATYGQPGGSFSIAQGAAAIDRQNTLREYADLTGTTIPTQTGISPQNLETLTGLLQTQMEQQAEQIDVMRAQYRVLSTLPPFGGSFAEGGVVPGPTGAARTIIAHGGEKVTPPGDDTIPAVVIEQAGSLNNLIDVRLERRQRDQVKAASRRLPSRGGGVLVG